MPRGKGERCPGWQSADGWNHCARVQSDHEDPNGDTWAHPPEEGTRPAPRAPRRDDGDRPRQVAVYRYTNEVGEALFEVIRFEPKDFRQRRPDGAGGWIWNLHGVDPVPYRLPALLASTGRVYVVEGEKDTDALAALGLTATCSPMGAGKWRSEFAHYFAGRDVTVIPDNDDPGRKHAATVAASLSGVARSVAVLELPGLPAKGDVSDWLAAGGTATEIERLADAVEPTATPRKRFQLYTLADLAALPEPHWIVRDHLMADSLAVVYGQSGGGKSFLVLDVALSMAAGTSWGGFEVEPGTVVYMSGEGAKGLLQRIRAWKRHHGIDHDPPNIRFITDAPALMEPADVAPFVAAVKQASERPALVVLDTLARCLVGGDENSAQDMGLAIAGADRIRTETGATVILVHHTGKNSDAERGSGALRGAADTMMLVSPQDGRITLTCTKQKDAAPFTGTTWKLEPVDGTGSCVPVRDHEAIAPTGRKRGAFLTPNQQEILTLIQETAGGLTLAELRDRTGIKKTTCYDAVTKLKNERRILYNEETGRYHVGRSDRSESFGSGRFGSAYRSGRSDDSIESDPTERPNANAGKLEIDVWSPDEEVVA